MRNNIYKFYLFCKPYLLFLENDLISDINIGKFSTESNKDDLFAIETDDIYFLENVKRIIEKDFILILQSFDLNYKFVNQIEIFGEDFYLEKNILKLRFETISINNVMSSINPRWNDAVELYKRERVSYLRNIHIETLLN